MIGHLGGLVPFYFLPLIIPFVVWVARGDDSEFVNMQSKEALNFQISLLIYEMACFLLMFTILGIPLAIMAGFVFIVTNFICSIKGAVRTSKGLTYKYPMNLRLIK